MTAGVHSIFAPVGTDERSRLEATSIALLQPLTKTAGRYLEFVGGYNGELSGEDGIDDMHDRLLGLRPAVLVAADSGSYETTSSRGTRAKMRLEISIVCISGSLRSKSARTVGDGSNDPTHDPGAYQMLKDVRDQIWGVDHGIEGVGILRPVRDQVVIQDDAITAWAIVFESIVTVTQSIRTDPVVLIDIEHRHNLTEPDGAPVNPVAALLSSSVEPAAEAPGEPPTASLLSAGGSTAAAPDPWPTPVMTPTADALMICDVFMAYDDSARPSAPTLSGLGLTWVQIGYVGPSIDASNGFNLWRFRAMGTAVAGQIAINHAESPRNIYYTVTEFAGANTAGADGSGAIGRSASATAVDAATITAEVGEPRPANGLLVASGSASADSPITADPDFTQLADVSAGSPSGRLALEYAEGVAICSPTMPLGSSLILATEIIGA